MCDIILHTKLRNSIDVRNICHLVILYIVYLPRILHICSRTLYSRYFLFGEGNGGVMEGRGKGGGKRHPQYTVEAHIFV